MGRASFDDKLDAYFLHVGQSLFMRFADSASQINMIFAHVGENLDLRGATLANIDLSGTSVVGELQLGGKRPSVGWKGKNGESGVLTLRNTHVGSLMDATDAWPKKERSDRKGSMWLRSSASCNSIGC